METAPLARNTVCLRYRLVSQLPLGGTMNIIGAFAFAGYIAAQFTAVAMVRSWLDDPSAEGRTNGGKSQRVDGDKRGRSHRVIRSAGSCQPQGRQWKPSVRTFRRCGIAPSPADGRLDETVCRLSMMIVALST